MSKAHHSRRWRDLSVAYRVANPLCVKCLADGRTVAATEVDHVEPVSQGGAMFDEGNLQSLCSPCHDLKTSRERQLVSGANLDGDLLRPELHGR